MGVVNYLLFNTNKPPGYSEIRQHKFKKQLATKINGGFHNKRKISKPFNFEEIMPNTKIEEINQCQLQK